MKNSNCIIQALTSILLILSVNLNSQTYSISSSDKEIKLFIKQNKRVLDADNIDSNILNWEYCDLYPDLKNCILNECIQIKNDSIVTNKLLAEFQSAFNTDINKDTSKFCFLKDKNQNKKHSKISVPLFSKNHQIAIIKIKHWCGNECGYGGILILKKNKKHWRKIAYRSTWIS